MNRGDILNVLSLFGFCRIVTSEGGDKMDKCIQCDFSNHEENSKYCENCGFELNSNYCTNERCYTKNNGNRIICRETACYCNDCGSPTEYFHQGLIEPITHDKKQQD